MTEAIEDAQRGSRDRQHLAGDAQEPWRDRQLPLADRVADLVARMTLEEKVHQLAGFWAAPSASAQQGNSVAPMQSEFGDATPSLHEAADGGLGQLTRVFGTEPVPATEGKRRLAELQSQIVTGNRFGIPAIAHEECLTGLAAFGATIFPCPLAWGASFDPQLVERMASAIGETMRGIGVHQGLAPVLDVTRDYRWGRTEETIGEDPYLVGTVGAAYTRGLEQAGVIATLKHFAGYSTSKGGRNLAPAALGPREFADVIVEPFVQALRAGSPRSVMSSYTDVDGVPSAADETLLSTLLREQLGFTGTVVADYFGISFLEALHGVAESPGHAAALSLRAGVDVELPAVRCYSDPLVERVRDGGVPESLVDRSVVRVLTQKGQFGMLDGDWLGDPGYSDGETDVDLDPARHRNLARELAEESVVLLANDGTLPLEPELEKLAVVGPQADTTTAMLGCYTFPRHVGSRHPDTPDGVAIPTLVDGLRDTLPGVAVSAVKGCDIDDAGAGTDQAEPDEEMAAAVEAARAARVCVLALGDRAGLFGGGTSGEGCDRETLELPGRQAQLARAVLDTGTPTVLTVLSGRPYALGGLAERAAAVVQAFFPGEEGGTALAHVLSGLVTPAGRLPVSVPRHSAGQPATYLHAGLGGRSDVSSVDPTALYPFGHGLTFTEFAYEDLRVHPVGTKTDTETDRETETVSTDGTVRVAATVRNTGSREGTEVVQLYLSDPVASVVRPVSQLAGWARVTLEPGQSARVEFAVHADRTSFTGKDLRRIVEPGAIEVAVGRSSADLPLRGSFVLDGPERVLGEERVLTVPATVTTT